MDKYEQKIKELSVKFTFKICNLLKEPKPKVN